MFIREYFAALWDDWIALMSGLASVALAFWAAYFPPNNIVAGRTLLWISAAASFVLASYRIWVKEYKKAAENHQRDLIIERLNTFIAEYNQIDDGWLSLSPENSSKLVRRDTYYKRVKVFLVRHWGESAVEQFKERKIIYLEELLGKLMNEDM